MVGRKHTPIRLPCRRKPSGWGALLLFACGGGERSCASGLYWVGTAHGQPDKRHALNTCAPSLLWSVTALDGVLSLMMTRIGMRGCAASNTPIWRTLVRAASRHRIRSRLVALHFLSTACTAHLQLGLTRVVCATLSGRARWPHPHLRRVQCNPCSRQCCHVERVQFKGSLVASCALTRLV